MGRPPLTFGGPRETCQYPQPYRLWQPHFRENICLEVLSFLIFNVSPGAPRQHMFPRMSPRHGSQHTAYASDGIITWAAAVFLHSFFSPLLISDAGTDGHELRRHFRLKSASDKLVTAVAPPTHPQVAEMTISLIGVARGKGERARGERTAAAADKAVRACQNPAATLVIYEDPQSRLRSKSSILQPSVRVGDATLRHVHTHLGLTRQSDVHVLYVLMHQRCFSSLF
ncbi:uncharacterized protein V6R79_005451 [Siganus canaliculatus]